MEVKNLNLNICKLRVKYHRDQSWVQNYFFCILMIFVMSLQILNIYFMLMILVYYVQVIRNFLSTINKNLEELNTSFIVN